MSQILSRKIDALGCAWAGFVSRHAVIVALACLGLGLVSFYLAATNLAINTDTTDMLSEDLSFRQHDEAMRQTFPQSSGLIVVVARARNAGLLDDAMIDLRGRLEEEPQLFGTIFDPGTDEFFRRQGLLYQDVAALEDLSLRLAEAQPFLAALNAEPNLQGLGALLGLLRQGLERGELDQSQQVGPARLLNALAAAVGDDDTIVDWQSLITGDEQEPGDHTRILTVKPPRDLGSLSPAGQAMKRLKAIVSELAPNYPGVTMALTGSVPLAEDELKSVADGMGLAGMLSVLLVVTVLFFGIRSFRLALAMMATLIFGLVVTAAFAAMALPALNLISVAFAVLFVGLSVDFGIHLILRFREAQTDKAETLGPLTTALRGVGPAIGLGALTSAIGFMSFLPTDYLGMAELGLIAGVGMGVALVANITLLPALISLMPPTVRPIGPVPIVGHLGLSDLGARHPRPVMICVLVLGVGALGLASQARFDFDPLNLKNAETESVQTLKALMQDQSLHPYRIRVMADDMAAASALAEKLKSLPEVAGVRTPEDFVAQDQDAKLDILFELGFIIGPSLVETETEAEALSSEAREAAWVELKQTLAAVTQLNVPGPLGAAFVDFHDAVQGLGPDADIEVIEHRLTQTLPGRLTGLREALAAEAFGIANIPKDFIARYLHPETDRVQVIVTPSGDMNDQDAIRQFARAVQAVAPNATGEPVIITAASEAVLEAFWQAGLIAVSLIAIVLMVVLRSLRLVLIVFAPIALAAVLTAAVTVPLGLSFNFANVIVLPLLFGLGIDGAIHMVLRSKETEEGDRQTETGTALVSSSTPKAVVYSFLTTIGSFGSIALSAHTGTASMGLLLAIAVGMTLVTTIFLLPSLLNMGKGYSERL